MKLARTYDQFQERGAEITGVSVDSPEQNRAMIDKLLLPFSLLSDPDGDRAIKTYGLWNEQGRIAVPSIVVVGVDSIIRWSYRGSDFADRPADEELLAALGEPQGWADGSRRR